MMCILLDLCYSVGELHILFSIYSPHYSCDNDNKIPTQPRDLSHLHPYTQQWPQIYTRMKNWNNTQLEKKWVGSRK